MEWPEFDCRDCEMHIIFIGAPGPPDDGLCAHCRWYPGWCDDPKLREILDPDNWARPPRPPAKPAGNGAATG